MRSDVVVALLALFLFVQAQQDALKITATRNIDISSQIVKSTVELQIVNEGKSAVSSVLYSLSEAEASKASWIQANVEKRDGKKLKLQKTTVSGAPKDRVVYKIELASPLAAGQSVVVFVKAQITQALRPFPAKISQSENQFVVYTGDAQLGLPYVVDKETTTIKYGSGKLVEFSQVESSKQGSGSVTYGPYTKSPAYASKPITVHYENNSPFLVVKSLERWIEVSHWGNVAVEEHIVIEHRGAQLVGEFSRLDYQMDRRGARQPVVKSFKTHLPVSARDIYYRDQIGNISTSTVSRKANRVEVELKPRFPLFGGWKTDYVLGYNVPSMTFLYNKGNDYALKVPFVDHVYENVVIEKAEVKIVLPEAVANVKVVNPFDVKRKADEVHKTYLDTTGRTVIVLEKENLVDSHSQSVTVYYEFERFLLFREPLIAVVFFTVVFFTLIIFSWCNFSIKDKPEVHLKKE
ncbi:unnamed protein product [Bursaphelenchus okinawaensis]|uniref:Dolichyl-diphosphooligosaccharide--protein glycosyltransferase subunit 1 n=1 Tax=Bursaphelenchus okinawaensis TaxID=465554 RepID=A0A811KX94_9BILA|nr:unnamed protein product [Bursaphelenchus okinawaensis]CAG9113190.1 unnamed protein product [Bursaphelenchus okinawaensis]